MTRHTIMPCIESKIFEFVTFVHIQMINAHPPEIYGIVLAIVESLLYTFKFGVQIGLTFQTAGYHAA